MDIAICTDNNFVMPTGVTMYSVCVNNQESEITFHVVINEVTSDNKKKLEEVISSFQGKSVIFYDIKKIDTSVIPALQSDTSLTITTYYRLFLSEILPSNIKKIIYLDGDIIVRQSLRPLWDINLDHAAIAATPESNSALDSFYERLGYPKETGYFNAGVLVINLEYWRSHNLLSEFKDFMEYHAEQIVFYDQDVLNYILRERKVELPIKYNLQSGFLWITKNYDMKYNQEIEDAVKHPSIVHFTGAKKPWHRSCRHPFRSTFLNYQSQTLWKDTPLKENRPLKLRVVKFFSGLLRKLKLIPDLPPYGKGFMDGLKLID